MKKSAEPSVYAGTVSISLLGGFSLEMNGATLTDDINRSLKLWSVLAYLVLHRNRPVPQSEFIELFWPEDNSSNPVNALKTLLYRIRAMLEPLFGPEVQPILAQRGAYSWNPAVTCELDADRFEALCFQASNEDLPDAARIELYRQAVALYQGDLLPKLNHQMWLIPLSVHYHTLYLEAVKALAALLDRAELFDEMQLVCQRASSLDNLDEGLHTLIVRSLLRQGKDAAALDHYEKATDLLYRNLGVRPSEELRALYTEIMATEKTLETDLGAIMADLKETAARPGAFVCEYGFFREAYRLEVRRAVRSGACVHLCLITVSLPDGSVPPLKVLSSTMEQLQDVLVRSLRRGDVVSKFSGAQFVVMLPAANFEDSNMVMDRVVNAFYQQHRRNFLKLTVRVRELELGWDYEIPFQTVLGGRPGPMRRGVPDRRPGAASAPRRPAGPARAYALAHRRPPAGARTGGHAGTGTYRIRHPGGGGRSAGREVGHHGGAQGLCGGQPDPVSSGDPNYPGRPRRHRRCHPEPGCGAL